MKIFKIIVTTTLIVFIGANTILFFNTKESGTNRLTAELSFSPEVSELAHSLTDGLTDDFSKAEALYQWCVDNLSYGNDTKVLGLFQYYSPTTVIKSGRGVCYQLSCFYCDLCFASGIKCIRMDGYMAGSDNHTYCQIQLSDGRIFDVDLANDVCSEKTYGLISMNYWTENGTKRNIYWIR